MKAAHADVGGAPCRKSGYLGRKRCAKRDDCFHSIDDPVPSWTAEILSTRHSDVSSGLNPKPLRNSLEFPRVYRIDYNQVLGLLANKDATFFNGW
jgi:hypothetical protein